MSAFSTETTLSGREQRPFVSGAAADASLVSSDASADGWLRCIQELRTWLKAIPRAWQTDGIEPPNRSTLNIAIEVAHASRRDGIPDPIRVLPDGEGGVIFERREGPVYETLTIAADGEALMEHYREGRLVRSERGAAKSLL